MILSDSAILKSIENNELVIKNCREDYLQNTSWDVRLGKNMMLLVPTKGIYEIPGSKVIDPKYQESWKADNFTLLSTGTIIFPGVLYLGVTAEYFELRKDLIGIFEGVSSLARLGLSVHLTAGYCDAGFRGHVTLEITTVYPFILYPNMIIGQMIFARTEDVVSKPYNTKDINYCNTFSIDPKPIPSNYHLKFDK